MRLFWIPVVGRTISACHDTEALYTDGLAGPVSAVEGAIVDKRIQFGCSLSSSFSLEINVTCLIVYTFTGSSRQSSIGEGTLFKRWSGWSLTDRTSSYGHEPPVIPLFSINNFIKVVRSSLIKQLKQFGSAWSSNTCLNQHTLTFGTIRCNRSELTSASHALRKNYRNNWQQ